VWSKPNTVSLVKGSGEGLTPLNAFDQALLNAGIGNLNLIKVSSILPSKIQLRPLPEIEAGSLIPAVYSTITSNIAGETISACVGAGFSQDSFGLLYEYSHRGEARTAEEVVKRMLEEGFKMRKMKASKIILVSAEHQVERVGCVVAAAILWQENDGRK